MKWVPGRFWSSDGSSVVNTPARIETKFPHIQNYGCVAHLLNLLPKDIGKSNSFQPLTKSTKDIGKGINSSQILRATFWKIQEKSKSKNPEESTTSLKLPADTRWGSSIKCIDSLLENKQSVEMLTISESVFLRTEVKGPILSDEFRSRSNSLHGLLSPVVKWITILEGDQSSLSQVAEAFFDIELSLAKTFSDSPTAMKEDNPLWTVCSGSVT